MSGIPDLSEPGTPTPPLGPGASFDALGSGEIILYPVGMGETQSATIGSDLAGRPSLWRQAEEKVAALTGRELEVLMLTAEGLSGPEIGATLGISSRTVDIYRGKLLRKLDVKSAVLAVRVAIYAALAQQDRVDSQT